MKENDSNILELPGSIPPPANMPPADTGTASFTPTPPVDNAHVTPGAEQFTGGPSLEKSLNIANIEQAKQEIPDVQVVGNGDTFQLICKASSKNQGWMKSTKAMHISGVGCVVQVTTQQRNKDGSYTLAEAVTFVPHTRIGKDAAGNLCLQAA